MRFRSTIPTPVLRGLLVPAITLLVVSCTIGGTPDPGPRPPQGSANGRPLNGPPPAGLEPIVDSMPNLFGVRLDTVKSDLFDQGKMWTFEYPPLDYFRQQYGFAPDSAWLRHARLAALRIPGCSASFVSPNGLVLTNHHCAREALTKVERPGENLGRDGFYAATLADERAVEDFHADQLIAIRDATPEVDRRLALAPASLRQERREEITREIGERIRTEFGGEAADIVVEMIGLYGGARTSAYVFKRYENVRLVMAPELEIGFFGGDPDNFTYPRYNLDFAFLRVYGDDGNPLPTDPYFRWSSAGVSQGDLTFVIGNPGSTSRLETFAQLMFRRDVEDRAVFDFIVSRRRTFQEYAAQHRDLVQQLDLENTIFGLENSEKAYRGQLAGLRDPVILARLRHREDTLKRAIEADSTMRGQYGGVFERMADVQQRKRQMAAGYTFLALGNADYESPTLNRALLAYQYLNALRQAQPIAAREELKQQILAIKNKPAELDEALIQDRLQGFVDAYGADSELARNVLKGRSPEGAAAFVRQNSVFADSARTAQALEASPTFAGDAGLDVVLGYFPTLVRFEQSRTQIGDQESTIAEQLGRARFAVYGTRVPPDATFSLRLADGLVQGYRYNGTVAPPYTTLFGLYDRYIAHRSAYAQPDDSPWDLPDRWRTPPADLNLSTPLNFASTSDIIGGNSGSPVVNRNLEVVGLIFDGNMESLPGSYIYLPETNRAVAVDVRGILEALRVIYDLDRIVIELNTGQLVRGEAELQRR